MGTNERAMGRREFLQTTAAGVAAAATVNILPAGALGGEGKPSANGKLNIAGVGVGGMGGNNLAACGSENIVALCDVDAGGYAAKTIAKYPKAKVYKDYRVMLDQQKDIDAVIIATPDHTHAVVAMAAMLFIGDKGLLMCGCYGSGPRLVPETRMKEYKQPAKSIERISGGHEQNWLRACKGGTPACSNFDYSGPFAETVLMGNLAIRFPGRALLWDGEKMEVTNDKDANAFIRRQYRQGWSL